MGRPLVTIRLREKLGPEASEDLGAALEDAKKDMLTAAYDRFDARLATAAAELRAELTRTQADVRQEIADGDAGLRVAFTVGLSRIRTEMTDMRVDVLRWAFVFWIGQVVATASLIALMLRVLGHP